MGTYFPSPPSGFNKVSVYENLHYVLSTSKKRGILVEIARSFPWILWMLWKKLTFEGLSYCGLDTMEKILDDSNQWFRAQTVERSLQARELIGTLKIQNRWAPPQINWVKC